MLFYVLTCYFKISVYPILSKSTARIQLRAGKSQCKDCGKDSDRFSQKKKDILPGPNELIGCGDEVSWNLKLISDFFLVLEVK